MNLITTFKITARCRELSEKDKENYNDQDIELELNYKDTLMILFKFTPSIFELSNGLTMVIKFNNSPENKLIGMLLIDQDGIIGSENQENTYIILNPQKVWSDVLEAYEQIRIINKLEVLSSLDIGNNEE